MPSGNPNGAFSLVDGRATVDDGAGNSLELDLVDGEVNWTEEGAPYTEARHRNRHKSRPILRKTGDGNVKGSLSCTIQSFRGSTGITPYEVFNRTGMGASWQNTAIGDKKASRLRLELDATAAQGAAQTVTFNYAVFENVKCDASGDGLWKLSADFTDYENAPEIA